MQNNMEMIDAHFTTTVVKLRVIMMCATKL